MKHLSGHVGNQFHTLLCDFSGFLPMRTKETSSMSLPRVGLGKGGMNNLLVVVRHAPSSENPEGIQIQTSQSSRISLAQFPVKVLRYPPCFQLVRSEPSAGAYMLDNPNMEGGDVLWLCLSCCSEGLYGGLCTELR